MEARLKIVRGTSSGQTIDIRSGKFLIGREDDCHLRPQSGFVSRHHCVILLDEFTLRVRDLGSQNGTFVNGRRIGHGEIILLDGDVISVGDLDFQILFGQPLVVEGSLDTGAALQTTALFEDETIQTMAPGKQPAAPPTPIIDAPVRPDGQPLSGEIDTAVSSSNDE
jgi:pSer/pThr/pTyr-binding forkhead associated (FHA) protein